MNQQTSRRQKPEHESLKRGGSSGQQLPKWKPQRPADKSQELSMVAQSIQINRLRPTFEARNHTIPQIIRVCVVTNMAWVPDRYAWEFASPMHTNTSRARVPKQRRKSASVPIAEETDAH